MFAVKFKTEVHKEWHVNTAKPTHTYIDEVSWFSADGDELQLLRHQFEGVPMTRGDHCMWTGEMANFLFRNLQ